MTEPIARLSTALSDRYTIERQIGVGGMATVYLARDLRHDRQVALKLLRPELGAVIGADRFLAEIRTTARLQHPHILPLFDSGEADGLLYYVMPYVEGVSLRDRLNRETQLPIGEAVRIASEVASALDYAHRHGVIHRDIKPENILLHDGQALVADFGIALAVSNAGATRMTETGMSLGTPHYMSPEQAMGEREISERSDVYALGAITYEMLTGEPPFTGPTAQAIVAKVVTEEPRPLIPKRHTIPPHVQHAVLTALEKLPADRFESAAEFSRALADRGFESAHAPAARDMVPASGSRAIPWRSVAFGAAALALVLAVAAVAGWTRGAANGAVSRFSVLLEQSSISISSDGPAISPDGSRFVYTNDDAQLVLRDRSQLRATPIAGTENAWGPFFSPDGATLGFFTGFPGALRTIPIDGGQLVTLVPDSTLGNGGSWSDDGWIYFTGMEGGTHALMRVRAEGGAPQVIARPDTTRDELFFFTPAALPGGGHVLATIRRRKGSSDVAAVDVSSGAVRVLIHGLRALYAASGHLIVLQGDGSVQAVRFDPKRATMTGRPIEVITGVRLSASAGSPIALSREGTLLYETYQPRLQVVRVDRNGTARPIDAGWTGTLQHVAVSPEGTRLAVAIAREGKTEVWVKVLDDGPLTQLSSEGTYSYRPAWTPDGRSVLFISDRSGRSTLYQMDADGGSSATPLLEHARGVDEGVISQDGQWVVVRIGSGGARDIYARRATGDTTLRPVVTAEFEEFSPTVSPDGRWIAYGSDQSRRAEIYVRSFTDAGRGRLQISRDGGTEPLWSPTGRELFYRNGRGDLVAAEFVTEPTFRVTAERPLFSARDYLTDNRHRNYAVSSDGRSFYFVRTLPGTPSQLVVVLNWFEELRRQAGM
ncbi:MAG TPA: protein kinase [Gemmatimonadaceae bacterium]|nr:protein kinase [Gemmatimonadaceae bacterium]